MGAFRICPLARGSKIIAMRLSHFIFEPSPGTAAQ